MIPVHVISLKRTPDRRAAVQARLDALGIPFRFFDAIDGYAMSKADMDAHGVRRNPLGHEVDPGDVGCYLSHIALYRELAGGPDDFVCVAEDDAVLQPDVRLFLEEKNLRALPAFDVLRFRHEPGFRLPVASFMGYRIFAPYRPTVSTSFQVYSRSGLDRILKNIPPPFMGIDLTLFAHGIIPCLRVLAVRPALSKLTGERSTIHTHNPEFATGGPAGWHILGWYIFQRMARLRVFRNFVMLWGVGALRRLVR